MSDASPENGRVLSVHFGRSANCSSVGSVIDFLYLGTVAASAVLAAIAVLLPEDTASHEDANTAKSESNDELQK